MRSIGIALILLTPLAAGAAPAVVGYLPAEGVTPAGEAEHFVGKKLFDYMNGGAELYLAYGFVDIGVRDYQQDMVKATAAVYQMGSPEDAFGVYAAAAKGEVVDVGVPATLARGMLSFHKGKHYIRVTAKSEPKKAKGFLLSLGKQLAGKIPGESKKPAAVQLLPAGAVSGSLRFLPNPETARTIWFDGEGELLLTKGAEAVTAFYDAGGADLQLTRITYPAAADATRACQALAKKYTLPSKDTCQAEGKTPDDVHTAFRTDGPILRWATGAGDAPTAIAWLKKIR